MLCGAIGALGSENDTAGFELPIPLRWIKTATPDVPAKTWPISNFTSGGYRTSKIVAAVHGHKTKVQYLVSRIHLACPHDRCERARGM